MKILRWLTKQTKPITLFKSKTIDYCARCRVKKEVRIQHLTDWGEGYVYGCQQCIDYKKLKEQEEEDKFVKERDAYLAKRLKDVKKRVRTKKKKDLV